MSPSKNPVIRLLHIKDEIDALLQAFSSVEKEQFATNYILVRATERAILIISEAAKALPDELKRTCACRRYTNTLIRIT